MAKQKGVITLEGTIGGINFYYLNGKPVARKAGGGFNGKAIKTKASMQRVRENGQEFGQCARANKAFRLALRPFYQGVKFTDLHSRMMGLFTSIKNLDSVHERGQRVFSEGLNTNEGRRLLTHFAYTPLCDIRKILPFRFVVSDSGSTLNLTGFDIGLVHFLSGSTHIELRYGVLDFDGLDYKLSSECLLVDRMFASDLDTLYLSDLAESFEHRFCVLGIRFYQLVDGNLLPLNSKAGVGFGILECF